MHCLEERWNERVETSGQYNLSKFDTAGVKEHVILISAGLDVMLVDDLSDELHVIELILEERAMVNYRIQAISDRSVQRDVARRIVVNLQGECAEARVEAVFSGASQDRLLFETMQHHRVKSCRSFVSLKTVLDDQASVRALGTIKVDKPAQQTDAELVNKNIVLSPGARVVSVPQLEIEADDVRCKHGAAVSKFTEDHFFYFQSRGIDRLAAQQLFIQAFLG